MYLIFIFVYKMLLVLVLNCIDSAYIKCPKIRYIKASDKIAYVNSGDQEQSHQGLHCLPLHKVF